MMTVTEEISFI